MFKYIVTTIEANNGAKPYTASLYLPLHWRSLERLHAQRAKRYRISC